MEQIVVDEQPQRRPRGIFEPGDQVDVALDGSAQVWGTLLALSNECVVVKVSGQVIMYPMRRVLWVGKVATEHGE